MITWLGLQDLKVRCLQHGMRYSPVEAGWQYWWKHYRKLNNYQVKTFGY